MEPKSKSKKNLFSALRFRWLIYTVFLFVAQMIYEQFAHGVNALSMRLIWLPAALYFFLILFTKKWRSGFLSAGIWTIIIALVLQGVFTIAGTGSPYLLLYFIVGGAMIVAGVLKEIIYSWK